MSIHNNIKNLRELKDVTQEYMAAQLGISQNAYSKIERGETDVPYSRLEQIANILDISIADIIGFDKKNLFLNISKNKDNSNNGIILQHTLKEGEKKLYEQIIIQLKEENAYLKKILDSYVK